MILTTLFDTNDICVASRKMMSTANNNRYITNGSLMLNITFPIVKSIDYILLDIVYLFLFRIRIVYSKDVLLRNTTYPYPYTNYYTRYIIPTGYNAPLQ